MPPSRLVEARALAERRGHSLFRTEEVPYSMLNRAVEYDLLPTCQRLGTGVLAFSALSGGWLSGRHRDSAAAGGLAVSPLARGMDAAAPGNATKLEAARSLGALAEQAGLSAVQLATAFVLRHPGVTSAVIGPRTIEHLEGYLAADGVHLSDDVLDAVDAIVPPRGHSGPPHSAGSGRSPTSREPRRRFDVGTGQASSMSKQTMRGPLMRKT